MDWFWIVGGALLVFAVMAVIAAVMIDDLGWKEALKGMLFAVVMTAGLAGGAVAIAIGLGEWP